MIHKLLLITMIIVLALTSSYAYRIKNVKKYDGYIETIVMCSDARRTFVHKTSKGYFASTYKHYNTFEEAVKASCHNDNNTTVPVKKKIFNLKHNAKICKTMSSMERLLDSQKSYYFSVSRECFTAKDGDKVDAYYEYQNGNLIDSYYKVMYDDKIHYIRANDMFVNHDLSKKPKKIVLKKNVKNTIKNKQKVKSKKVTKKISKVKKHIRIYHCNAKSKSAGGWANAVSLSRAKRSAIYQCNIRSAVADPCHIEKCTKK